ncbi:MAG: alpha/beta fold hydrolase [Myxococcota bacterium]|nr:alpha/beta fold hydrolase [Myxococcota bacterium]
MFKLLFLLVGASIAGPVENVKIPTEDGLELHAFYQPSEDSQKAVLFLHMLDRSAKDWEYLAQRMNRAGFNTLALDLRSHGENAGEGKPTSDLNYSDFRAMIGDVGSALAWLKKRGTGDISIVGASIGSSLALLSAGTDPDIRNLVLLSPGVNYKGLELAGAMETYGERPVLIAVSSEDGYSAKSALVLDAEALGKHHMAIYDNAGHGTKMLNRSPKLEPLIQSWLLQTWGVSHGERNTDALIQTGDVTPQETSGKKFGED